jgi:ketosteroid isomerase-like protein
MNIADDPWTISAGLLLLAGFLFIAWASDHFSQKVRSTILISMLLCIGGIATCFLVDHFVITPAEEIRQSVRDLALACESGDVDRVMSYLAPQEVEMREVIRTGLGMVKIEPGIHITDMQVSMSDGQASGRSHFRANGRITTIGYSSHIASRWSLTWKRDPQTQKWVVHDIERLDPLKGNTMEILERKGS